jgi:STE24 endopeptidase
VTSRGVLVATVVLLTIALVVLVALLTPWRPMALHGAPAVPADPARDFTAAQLAREDAYHAAVRPPGYVSLGLSLVFACLLGFSPLGARLVERVAAPLGGGWGWQVLLGTLTVTLLARLLVLPWDAWGESVRRRYGLSTRTWGAWAVDVAKSYAVGLVLTLVVLFLIVGLARWSPQWWWTLGAALGAALVALVSFAYPIVVEPVFNKFEPMPPGELRSSLLALARDDGVRVDDVLVADASRRTSSLNAYVSGFGSTRRIVVYDTLVDSASNREIELIVAHELGHAKRKDVVWGTLQGAVGLALLVCLLALVARSTGVLARAEVSSLADGRSIALVLAVLAVLGFVSGPAQALVSRRVETRADVHALELTRDPESMVAMQQRLSTTNLSDLDPSPIVFGMFSTHPTGPQRIALARSWARVNGVPVPPSSVASGSAR